jgi:hypothetical protein
MQGWKAAVALMAMAATAVGAAGCGSSPHAKAGPPSTAATTVNSRVATTLPTSIANDDAKRGQVEIESCTSVPGGWAARGIAFNRGHSSVHYDITIFFTKTGDTYEGSGTTSVDVPAGGTSSWAVSGHFAAGPSTRCVVVGVG